jgi:hypothetical protein
MPIHDNVANVLERETGETIDNWYSRVEKENDLVSIFQTLQFHVKDERPDELLPDVMAIANEVDSQLAQAMTSYISEANQDSKPIKP